MVVYVDDSRVRATIGTLTGNWSHLFADSQHELFAFAQLLGITHARLRHCGLPEEHFAITDNERGRAIRSGARPISAVESAAFVRRRQAAWPREVEPAPGEPGTVVRVCGTDRAASTTVRRPPRYNPRLQRHSWQHDAEHIHSCVWCGIRVTSHEGDRGRWWKSWTWPDGQADGDNQAGGNVPRCPGPVPAMN